MPQYSFGNGSLFLGATMDALGNAIAAPTIVKVGEVQSEGLEFTRDVKKLYGQDSSPMEAGGGKEEYKFKLQWARINGRMFNDFYFGTSTMAAGTANAIAEDVAGTVGGTPYQITPTVPNSGTWSKDLGVVDASTGLAMTRVASAPAAGQYSVAAGVYTFAAADTGKGVLISFGYTYTSALAKAITISSRKMGTIPYFGLDLSLPFNAKNEIWRFPKCFASKLALSPKQDDFQMFDMDVEALADPVSKLVGYAFLSE